MRSFRRSLALLLALAMILTTFAVTTVSAQTFDDTSGHWAAAIIDKWSSNGVINGYEDNTFRPDAYITRAELAKIIASAKGYTTDAEITFSDVAGDEWFADALKKCVAQSVIGGYEDGTFRPDAYITREEASTMIVRAYNINATALLSFSDSDQISAWAQNAITALVGANVIGGYEDGTFKPKDAITRAEVVKLLDGAAAAVIAFPQATDSTGGTNSVGTIGNLGGYNHGGGSISGGSGGSPSNRSYTVSFDANGGRFSDGKTSVSVSITQNGIIGSRVEVPTYEGAKFDGWYTSIDAANNLVESKKWNLNTDNVTKGMTLYAGWYVDGNVTVAFESNAGSAVNSQTVQSGSLISEPAAPTRANFTFTGWYLDNNTKTKFDFSNQTVRKHMKLYAGWQINSDYSGAVITIPNETDPESSFKTGKIEAMPPTAIAGETVKLSITPPEGFSIAGIKSITYLANVTEGETTTEKTVELDPSAIIYDKASKTYSFVMPADAIGSVKIAPKFETSLDGPKPSKGPIETLEPQREPTYYFSAMEFDEYDANNPVPANKVVGGIKVSKDAAIDNSGKDFPESGFGYSRRLKLGTATLKFNVNGPCKILIDAVTASSVERSYRVLAGSTVLGEFNCGVDELPTGEVNYTGGAGEITIAPNAGINVYGIYVEYTGPIESTAPSAAPTLVPTTAPTAAPSVAPSVAPSGKPLVAQETAKAWTPADNYEFLLANTASSNKTKFDLADDINMDNLYLRSSAGSKPINYEDMLLAQNADAEQYFDPENPRYFKFADGMIFESQVLNFRPNTEMDFMPSATKPGKLKLYYKGQAAGAIMVTVYQGDAEYSGEIGENGETVEVDVKALERVTIRASMNGWLSAVVYIPEGSTIEPIKPSAPPKQDFKVTVDSNVTGGTVQIVKPEEVVPSAAPSAAPSVAPSAAPPEGSTSWVGDGSHDGSKMGTELMPGLTTLFDDKADGKKYVMGEENGAFANGEATGTALKYEASADGTLTIGITGLGTVGTNGKPKTVYMVEAGGSEDSPVAKLENTSTTDKLNGNVEGAVTAGKTYYIYGAGTKACFASASFTPAAAAASVEAAEETLVNELTVTAGETVKVKVVPAKEGDKVTMYSTPSVEFKVGENGYYEFTMPSSDITVGAAFGDAAPPSAVPSSAPTDEYIKSAPVTTETTWLFSKTLLADYIEELGGKTYLKGNADYNGLVIYAAKGVYDEAANKVNGSTIEIDDSGKTVGEIEGVGRLKFGGTGKDQGGSSVRMMTFMPGVAGKVTISAAHASSSGTARTLNVYQGDTLLDGGMPIDAGAALEKTFTVSANTIVKIYSASSGINAYGVKFIPGE